MSNIDKQALRQTAEKAQEHGVFNMDIHSQTVLALLDELAFLDRRNAELNSTLERWAVDRARSTSELEAKDKRIAELEARQVDLEHIGYIQVEEGTFYLDEGMVKSAIRAAGIRINGED